MAPSRMTHWTIEMDPRKIYYLKFILEGYDNLATISTIDARSGTVDVCISPESEDTVRGLLKAEDSQIGLRRIQEAAG